MSVQFGPEFLKAMSALDNGSPFVAAEMPDNVYRDIPAINHSSLKKMELSADRFKWEMEHPSERSSAMAIGSAIHMAILEPDKFDSTYKVKRPKPVEMERPPELAAITRKSKEGKAKIDEWEATWKPKYDAELAAWEKERGCSTMISSDEMDVIYRICERTHDNEEFAKYFRTGHKEKVFTAKDPETGLWLKCKPDNFIPELNVIIDLKTTDCAAPGVFNYDITKYKYYVQAAFYMDVVELATGSRPDAFAIIAVEKARNCDIAKFTFEDCDLEIGRKQYRAWLRQLAECLHTNKWPGYANEWNVWKPARYMIEGDF